MSHRRSLRFALRFVSVLALTAPAHVFADGGVIRLRENTGPFVVTVFTEPADLRVGPVDLSVLLQRRDSGEVILDATVDLFFVPPPGATISSVENFCGPDGTPLAFPSWRDSPGPTTFPPTRRRVQNQLFHEFRVNLSVPGDWQMRIQIRHGDSRAPLTTRLPVIAPRPAIVTLWPYLALPISFVSLFVVHQRLKRRTGRDSRLDWRPPFDDAPAPG